MTNEKPTYQRLPGKKRGFLIGHHTLWQGADHLLQIYSRLGVEDYKRYYFNDIQAIITRKTGSGRIQNIVIGALSGLFCLFAVASGGGWSVFHAAVAAAILLILLINVFKGPTCETVLLTAVQTEKLHSLYRLKTTEPVMNRLRSIIERRQGRIDPNIFDKQSVSSSGRGTSRTPGSARQRSQTAQKHERGRVHLFLFALLVTDGFIVAAGFLLTHMALTLIGSAVTMLLGICVVVALVRQNESNLKRPLRTLTWSALGYVCFSFIAGYIISMGIAFRHPEILRNQWELFKLFSTTSPWESPLIMTVNVIAIICAALIGIPGLFMLKNPQQAIHRQAIKKLSSLPTRPAQSGVVKRVP
jgi:hypothetical protein